MKICLALLVMLSMLLSGLISRSDAPRLVGLDGLATLLLPASLHFDDTPEQHLPAARRLLRKPYVNPEAFPDRLTYYLSAHDRQTMGGRVVPVLLRVTLYAPDTPLPGIPDSTYFQHLVAENYHYDGQGRNVYDQFRQLAPAADHLYYVEERSTSVGWFSTSTYRQQHFILTDPASHVRLFLSADERKLARPQAERLLRDALRSLRRDPEALANYFRQARRVVLNRPAVEQANIDANLQQFNQQLAAADLPPLQPVERYAPGRFVDVGPYFYGLSSAQEVFFAARLGSAPPTQATTPPYFSNNNPQGRYLPSFQQQAILQRGLPAGHELLLRTGVSLPLWYPPEEVARFQLADLVRETTESVARVRRTPGFVPATAHAPVRWTLSQMADRTNATPGTRTDYSHHQLAFGPVTGQQFVLSYLGLRTADELPPQAVFTLEIFDGSPRYRPVAADAQYLAVDANKGGTATFEVAGRSYRVRIEPPTRAQLVVDPIEIKQ